MFNVNDILDKYINNINSVSSDGKPNKESFCQTNNISNENINLESKLSVNSNTSNVSKGATLEDDNIFDDDGNFIIPEKPLIYLMLGKPGLGKTVNIKNLIYNYSKKNYFKFGICYVATKFNHSYDFLPDNYVYENYNDNHLKKYIDKLKEYKKKKGFIPNSFICIDDNAGNMNLYSPLWTSLITTFRHLNLTIILGVQSLSCKGGASTLLRQCVNVAFLYRTVYHDTLYALYESFGGLCDDYHEFSKMFLQVTSEKHTCLMFINDRKSKDESYYSYKADVAPEFKLKY